MIEFVYALVCAAMLVVILFLCGYTIHALYIASYHKAVDRPAWPKVALVIPCKGIDADLEENLRRHFRHDYPDYMIVFAVASADDPACAIIRNLIASEKRPAALVVAPRLPDCVEKASNQVAAFQSLGPDVEVIVCADSDGLARDGGWLRTLVAGLDRSALISGFRWYIPGGPSFVGGLQSAWDSTWLLLHALGKTTWGGAMAFTRESYQRLHYEEGLRRAITDDLALQVATHRGGESTGFTPGGMVISEPAQHFGDFYSWAVRQSQMVRMVTFWIWFMGFCAANVFGCFFALSAALFFVPDLRFGWLLPTSALAVAALYYLWRGYVSYRLARLFFPDHPNRTASLRWVYYWANPLTDLLAPVVAYHSLFAQTIRWRSVSYRIKNGGVVRVN